MRFTELRKQNDKLRRMTGVHEREQVLRDLFKACSDTAERVHAAMFLTGRLSPPTEGLTTGIKEAFIAKDLGLDGRQSLESIGEAAMARCETGRNVYDLGDVWAIFRSYLEDSGRSHQDKSQIISIVLFEMAEEKEDVPFLLQILCEKVNNGIDDKIIIYALAGRKHGAQKEGPIPQSYRDQLSRAFALNPSLGEWIWALDNPQEETAKALLAGRVSPGVAFEPQLCARVDDIAKVLLEHKGMTLVQPKLDGQRVHIHVWANHRGGHSVKVFSRALKDVTEDYPEVVEAARGLRVRQHAILDGELVALDAQGGVAPFSVLQRRLGRQQNKEAVRIGVVLYDLLLWDDVPMYSTPYSARLSMLGKLVAGSAVLRPVEHQYCASVAELQAMMMQAYEEGEEGLVCKDPDSFPEPGARNKAWIKLKPDYMKDAFQDTYDLAVIGYTKGRGRRYGKIGALWVGILHRPEGVFVPVCKVGTGLKERDLDEFQKRLTPHHERPKVVAYSTDEPPEVDVWVIPDTVIEVGATGGMTKIDKWAGFSLRFPYFVRVRDDKTPDMATSTDEVQAP